MSNSNENINIQNGINSMVSYGKMSPAAKRIRDFYNIQPDAGIIQAEFGGCPRLDR